MKKLYMKPTVEVVNVQAQQLLTNSPESLSIKNKDNDDYIDDFDDLE